VLLLCRAEVLADRPWLWPRWPVLQLASLTSRFFFLHSISDPVVWNYKRHRGTSFVAAVALVRELCGKPRGVAATACSPTSRFLMLILHNFLPSRSKIASATLAMKLMFWQEDQQKDAVSFLFLWNNVVWCVAFFNISFF
jgi:hypothetical protein